ncbi:hypothetical protein E2P81_ATG03831 [Venturia nashicola]|nr:hypothetical protein E2P81_ATG03831 [Venturia nashicola]
MLPRWIAQLIVDGTDRDDLRKLLKKVDEKDGWIRSGRDEDTIEVYNKFLIDWITVQEPSYVPPSSQAHAGPSALKKRKSTFGTNTTAKKVRGEDADEQEEGEEEIEQQDNIDHVKPQLQFGYKLAGILDVAAWGKQDIILGFLTATKEIDDLETALNRYSNIIEIISMV